jgi:hypothetical protein
MWILMILVVFNSNVTISTTEFSTQTKCMEANYDFKQTTKVLLPSRYVKSVCVKK